MRKILVVIFLLLFTTKLYANDFTLNCDMNMYGNTTSERVAKTWVNPISKFVVNGEDATFHYNGKTLSGSAQDKGGKLKMYFSRTVTMMNGPYTKKVKANLIVDYFYKSQKIAADWRFVAYKDLGTIWGKCTKD